MLEELRKPGGLLSVDIPLERLCRLPDNVTLTEAAYFVALPRLKLFESYLNACSFNFTTGDRGLAQTKELIDERCFARGKCPSSFVDGRKSPLTVDLAVSGSSSQTFGGTTLGDLAATDAAARAEVSLSASLQLVGDHGLIRLGTTDTTCKDVTTSAWFADDLAALKDVVKDFCTNLDKKTAAPPAPVPGGAPPGDKK